MKRHLFLFALFLLTVGMVSSSLAGNQIVCYGRPSDGGGNSCTFHTVSTTPGCSIEIEVYDNGAGCDSWGAIAAALNDNDCCELDPSDNPWICADVSNPDRSCTVPANNCEPYWDWGGNNDCNCYFAERNCAP